MSKAEIVEELSKLTPAEREEIRLKLAELDGKDWLDEDDPLTDGEKALLDARLALSFGGKEFDLCRRLRDRLTPVVAALRPVPILPARCPPL